MELSEKVEVIADEYKKRFQHRIDVLQPNTTARVNHVAKKC